MSKERLILTDAAWQEIAVIFERVEHKAGSLPLQSDRVVIEAVWYVVRTGLSWRDLPQKFGCRDAVYNRFRRWEKRRVWQQLWHN